MDATSITPRPIRTGTFKATPKIRFLIDHILETGVISYGPVSKQFEKIFSQAHNCSYGILSNSGTSSLHVALQAAKELYHWPDGSEVIVPATTFVATANIVHHNRMKPVLVDVDPNYYGIDPEKFSQAVTSNTRAVIPVHLFGQPCDMTGVLEVANAHDLFIIEDSCEAMFVSHNGRMVGSMGNVGCFSFYMAHLLTAGVGGMSITNDPALAARMRSLVNHGLSIENLNTDENFSPRPMINRRFIFDSIGHSFRITEFEAALALAQMDNYEYQIMRPRRRNATHLSAGLESINKHAGRELLRLPKIMEGNTHAWMMYPIMLAPDEEGNFPDKESLTSFLNDHDIETRDMTPLIIHPHYTNQGSFPVSEAIVRAGFYIGCHQDLSPEDIRYVVQTFGSYYL